MYAMLIFAVLFFLSWQFPTLKGFSGWLAFLLLIGRFLGIDHPPSEIEEPLDSTRIILGWIALLIFLVCFIPTPFDMALTTPEP
jgi:hypothetical protein